MNAMIVSAALAWSVMVGVEPVSQPSPAALSARDAREEAEDLAGLLGGILEKHKVPALAAAAVREGRIVARGVVGIRAAGSDEKATLGDLWHLGSCTKAMTATLAATFVERGELTWETTVGEVFADVKMDEGWRGVTLRQLLTNRGGAPAGLDAGGLWERLFVFEGTPREAREMLVAGVLGRAPAQEPGVFVYSNAGFSIAGAMLERKGGESWEELVVGRVLRPLGVTSAGFGAPGSAGSVDQPRGHRRGKAVAPGKWADNPSAIAPAGRAHMTIEDWARFAGAHASGETVKKDEAGFRLLKPETFAMLHTPGDEKDRKNAYAMGWVVAERAWGKGARDGDRGRVLTHAGSNTMWFCVAWVAPEREFAVVVATNAGDEAAQKATDEAAGAIIERMLKDGSR